MFNVRIKILAVAIATAGMMMSSCGSNSNKDDIAAEPLYKAADSLFQSGNYNLAGKMLDSIDHTYPLALRTRDKVLLLRPQVTERQTAALLSETDSLLTMNAIKGDSLRNLISFVDNPLEGYFVASSTGNVDVRSVAGLHGRISPAFKFYMTASSPAAIKSIAVRIESDGESVTSPEIPYDGERNNRSGKCETLTFTEAESAPLGDFMVNHAGSAVSVVYIGENGLEKHFAMPTAQRDALVTEYRYAKSVIQDKFLRLEKERLTKQLEIARMQIARTQSRGL